MRGHRVVRKTQQTQMSDNLKIRLEERNTGASWFSRDGTVLATTPPDAAESPPNGEADAQPGPFYHATHSAETLTASAWKLSLNPIHGPTKTTTKSPTDQPTSTQAQNMMT